VNRLFVQWSVAMVLAIVLSAVGLHIIVTQSIERHRSKVVPPFGALITEQLWQSTDGLEGDALIEAVERFEERMKTHAVLLAVGSPELPEHVGPRLVAGDIGWDGGPEGVRVFVPLRDGRHVVVLGPVAGLFDPHPADVARAIAMMLAVVAVLTTMPLIPMVRRLRRLEKAAKAIGDGDLTARVPVKRPDAIGSLERHFNRMAGKVEELLAGQQQLVQAVAHEIRTPISRVQFGLEMVELAKTDAERQQRREDVLAELEELDRLVGELLVFTRHDAGTAELAMESVDVADAVAQQVRRMAERYPDVAVTVDVADGLLVHAHARSFHRVLQNLVANALRYAASEVVVRAHRDDDGLVLEVVDDGPGVPVEDRESIFEPFGRVDPSRDRSTGGVGLGLAIVRRILEAHGGTVEVGEGRSGGARFVTHWP
jgi:two-component system, OmpR family, sensor histidine kinase RstB